MIAGAVGGLLGGKGASYGNAYMHGANGQVNRFFRHVSTDGIRKAGRFYLRMTSTYSKRFISGTMFGIAKATVGAHTTSHLLKNVK